MQVGGLIAYFMGLGRPPWPTDIYHNPAEEANRFLWSRASRKLNGPGTGPENVIWNLQNNVKADEVITASFGANDSSSANVTVL